MSALRGGYVPAEQRVITPRLSAEQVIVSTSSDRSISVESEQLKSGFSREQVLRALERLPAQERSRVFSVRGAPKNRALLAPDRGISPHLISQIRLIPSVQKGKEIKGTSQRLVDLFLLPDG